MLPFPHPRFGISAGHPLHGCRVPHTAEPQSCISLLGAIITPIKSCDDGQNSKKCPCFANRSFRTCWRPLAGPVAAVRPFPIMTECIKAVTCFSLSGHSMNFCSYQCFIHRPVQIQQLPLSIHPASINSSILIRCITPEKQNLPNSLWKPNGHFEELCQWKLDLPLSVDHFVLKNISHRTKSCPRLWQSGKN